MNYDKRVVYFLARPVGGEVRLEDRFTDWRWAPFATALDSLYYKNDRSVLRKAMKRAGLTGRT